MEFDPHMFDVSLMVLGFIGLVLATVVYVAAVTMTSAFMYDRYGAFGFMFVVLTWAIAPPLLPIMVAVVGIWIIYHYHKPGKEETDDA